jgi:hypothetical protein
VTMNRLLPFSLTGLARIVQTINPTNSSFVGVSMGAAYCSEHGPLLVPLSRTPYLRYCLCQTKPEILHPGVLAMRSFTRRLLNAPGQRNAGSSGTGTICQTLCGDAK